MNLTQLQTMAKEIAKTYWNMEFNIPIKLNSRLSRARARFCRRGQIGKVQEWIDFQPDVLKFDSEENVIKTLKHEVCHWALFHTKPGQHRDGHPTFENELRRIGSHSTGVVSAVGNKYMCKCNKCDKKFPFNSEKMARRREYGYVTRCCHSSLTYVGPELLSRTETAAETPEPAQVTLTTHEPVGTLTSAELSAKLGMDAKTLRKKLRNAGFSKGDGSWEFTPQLVEEVKKKLGL